MYQNKNTLLDYNPYVCHDFLFPFQIPAEYRSLYSEVSMILSKCPAFYAKVLIWVRTCERRPIRLSWGVGGVAPTKHVVRNQWEGWIIMSEVVQVCAKLFCGNKFIAPSPILNLTLSLAPGSVMDLESELHGSSGSMILRPRL